MRGSDMISISTNARKCMEVYYTHSMHITGGRDSSVGIATGYELDGPGIESRWGRDFRTCTEGPWDPPSLLYHAYRFFPGDKAAGTWR
jgi:hypothetical protein